MSAANLHQLEREVEAARAKLTGDLSTLRSPAAMNQFTEQLKQEARDAADSIVDKAKSTAQSTVQGIVDDLKAKAAANPAAALAIGAGVAWRLIRHPPIATVLIGTGLFSLLRTAPARANGHGQIDYLSHAQGRLREQASEVAEIARGHAMDLASTVNAEAGELAETAKASMAQWRNEAVIAVHDAEAAVREQASVTADHGSVAFDEARRKASDATNRAATGIADTGASVANQALSTVQNNLPSEESRDKILLGVAGFAVAAALGMAYQRRVHDAAGAD